MSRHRDRARAAKAPARRKTLLDNPIVWMALQIGEFVVVLLIAFLALPHVSQPVRLAVLLTLGMAFVGLNYWLRRRFTAGG